MDRALLTLLSLPILALAAPTSAQQGILVPLPRAAPTSTVQLEVDLTLDLEPPAPHRGAARRRAIGVLVAGAAVLAAGYGASVAWPSLTEPNPTDLDLIDEGGGLTITAVPLVGPFLALAAEGIEPLERAALALLGAAQVAGLSTLIAGIVLVTTDDDAEAPSVYVLPTPGGAIVGGQF